MTFSANRCNDWDIMEMRSVVPKDWPDACDVSEGAPPAPKNRDLLLGENEAAEDLGSCLPTVKLSVDYLKCAMKYAHHNMQTLRPNHQGRKKFWNKLNLTAFLRACGLNNSWIEKVYQSAMNKEAEPPCPPTWERA